MEKVLAIVMAGGVGERLQPLTQERSKAAVPFGGKYRLIDFTLSNCINSGVRQIYVLTQYRLESLHRHIQDGWGISGSGLGDFIYCIPPQQKVDMAWYRGTADAVRQNTDLLGQPGIEDVLVLSGDHVCKMDYSQFVEYHKAKNACLTISAVRARREEAAGRLGVLEIDDSGRLVGFEEKPAQPKALPDSPDYCLASMGVYAFKSGTLFHILEGDEEDFGRHVIPGMIGKHDGIYVYDYEKENRIEETATEVKDGTRRRVLVPRARDSSYWKDVGTIDSYYGASMDLVGVDPVFNLYGEKWPFRTLNRSLPPSKFVLGAWVNDSIVSDGCIISGGTVWNSILSTNVIVERGATVEQSIVFDDVTIEPGARVRRAIVDKDSKIMAGASVGFDREMDKRRGFNISDGGIVVVPKGLEVCRKEPALI